MRILRHFSGIVLAGGGSTRMGRDKAFLPIGDGDDAELLVVRARRALTDAGAAEVASIGGDVDRLAALGFEARPDSDPGTGPLGGLLAGLRAAKLSVAVVMPCDLPAIDAVTVRRIVDALIDAPAADAAMPFVAGIPQVLTAAYRTSAIGPLAAAFDTGERSVRAAVEGLSVVEVTGVDPRILADLDSPDDLDRYAQGTDPPGTRK